MRALVCLLTASVLLASSIACRQTAPSPRTPQIAPLADAAPHEPLVFDLRSPEEVASWRLRSGIARAEGSPEGMLLDTRGEDPQISRPVHLVQGAVDVVEIRTQAPLEAPFRVYLQIGGREIESWAMDTEPLDGGTRHVARFGDMNWRYGVVDELRIDPPAGDRQMVLSSVTVVPMAERGAHAIEFEQRQCLRAGSVTASVRDLQRDRMIVTLGVPPQGRFVIRPGELVVEVKSPEGRVLHQSLHRIPLRQAAWHRFLVDFEVPEDEHGELRLEMAVHAPGRPRELLEACYAEPQLLPGRAPGKGPINVVLVSIDTLRADHVKEADFLDRMGWQGRRFTHVWASSNWTLPSHVSLFTSVDMLGHDQPPPGLPLPFLGAGVPESLPTLAEAMHGAGYRTAATTDGGFVGPYYGFARGFERYAVSTGNDDPLRYHLRFAQDLAAETRDRPFFLFVHTFKVHDYFLNTADYQYFVDEEKDAALIKKRNLIDPIRDGKIDAGYVERLYASGVHRGDEFLEQLVNILRLATGDAPLLVIVTSDHGESFGEKPGIWHHGTSMYEEQLRVPFVAWGNFDGAPRGVSHAPTSTIDIAPSLLRFLGIEVPSTFRGEQDRLAAEPPTGRSAPVLAGNTASAQDLELRRIDFALVRDGWKYLRTDRFDGETIREECFELTADPEEARNRIVDARSSCDSFPGLYASRMQEELQGALLVRSGLPTRFEVESEGSPRVVAVRSARPSARPIARLEEGAIEWRPAAADDVLAVLFASRPGALTRIELDGRLAAERLAPEQLGTVARPLKLQVASPDGSPGSAEMFARTLPAAQAETPVQPVDDTLLEQLKALGYVE